MRFVRAVARGTRWLAIAAAIAALLFGIALYDEGWYVAAAFVAGAAAVVLFLFSFALGEAADLPEKLRNAPAQVGGLRAAVDDLARARGSRLPRSLWRLGRQAASTRELATPWAPLLPLINVPFLAATFVAALATPALLLIALIVVALET